MGDEKKAIRALKVLKTGARPERNDWAKAIVYPPWGGLGSDNIPAMSAACELRWHNPGSARFRTMVDWWVAWCENQEDPRIGHGGRELGSRIYDSWTVSAAVFVLNTQGIPFLLQDLLRKWLRRHWLLIALGTVTQSQGQHWYAGPTVTFTGMRSVKKRGGVSEVRGLENEVDPMLAMAIGLPWSSKRTRKMVGPNLCDGYDMGLSREDQIVLESVVRGGIDAADALQIFIEDLEGFVTRVPMRICRWADGSAGTMIERDIGVSTPPCYGMIMHGREPHPAEYLIAYKAKEKYIHGEAGEDLGEWWARIGDRFITIPHPEARRLYSVVIDRMGIYLEEATPVFPPTEPEPVDPTQTPEWQLEAALRALRGNDRYMAHTHAAVAERMLR